MRVLLTLAGTNMAVFNLLEVQDSNFSLSQLFRRFFNEIKVRKENFRSYCSLEIR